MKEIFKTMIDDDYRMLQGCMNRLCISHDNDELKDLYISATYYLNMLYYENLRRLEKEKE